MNTESFVFYESVWKAYKTLRKVFGLEAADHFFECIVEFGLYGVIPPEDDIVYTQGFEQTATSIYHAKVKRHTAIENGKKGGRKERYSAEEVANLKDQGLTNKQIAQQLGYSEETVRIKLKQAKEKTTENPNNPLVNLNEKENKNDNETVNKNDNETTTETDNENDNDFSIYII